MLSNIVTSICLVLQNAVTCVVTAFALTECMLCRDVIDISIGHMWDRRTLLFAFVSIAFGCLLFVWCLIADKIAAAFCHGGAVWYHWRALCGFILGTRVPVGG